MKKKIPISATLLLVSLLTLTASTLNAQIRSESDRNIQADSLEGPSQNLYFLLNPSIGEPALKPTYNGSLNPFTKYKSRKDYALLGIASSLVKSRLRGPIYRPNYGPGIPPPFFLMEPLSVTDYKQKIESLKSLSNDSY